MMSKLPEENKSNSSGQNFKKRSWEEDNVENGGDQGRTKRAAVDDSSAGGWDEDLHKEFVSAVFEIGLRNASPAVILENMNLKAKAITSERVKSKLQKYRNNKEKSKQEYMDEYSAFLARLKAVGYAGIGTQAGNSPFALLEMMGCEKLLGGDAAAFLSYAAMNEQADQGNGPDSAGSNGVAAASSQLLHKDINEYVDNFAGTGIPFPELTEAEKKSALGLSMTLVMGLFMSMNQHLKTERVNAERFASGTDVEDNSKMPAVQKEV